MLYNKDWNKKTLSPFSLDSLIAWLETKKPYIYYQYDSNNDCMLARYFSDCGFKHVVVTPCSVYYHGNRVIFPPYFDHISQCHPWNYGAALERALDYRNFLQEK